MLIKQESTGKKKLENKYVFRRKVFLHEKYYDQNFYKKEKFHYLVQADSPFNKSFMDFSGSNNQKGDSHESNRAKEEKKRP